MNDRDTETLALNFEARTGVDLRTYRRPEIFELFADLLRFPLYAAKSVVLPFAGYLVPTVLIAFAVTGTAKTIVAAVAAVCLSLLNALTTAAVIIVIELSDDIDNVLRVGVTLAAEVTKDVRNVEVKQENRTLSAPSFVETLNGVMHVVIVPVVVSTLKRKIPLIGRLFAGMVRWFAGLTTRRTVRKLAVAHPEVLDAVPDASRTESWLVEKLEDATQLASATTELTSEAIRWARWLLLAPAILLLAASLGLSVLVYWLILF